MSSIEQMFFGAMVMCAFFLIAIFFCLCAIGGKITGYIERVEQAKTSPSVTANEVYRIMRSDGRYAELSDSDLARFIAQRHGLEPSEIITAGVRR